MESANLRRSFWAQNSAQSFLFSSWLWIVYLYTCICFHIRHSRFNEVQRILFWSMFSLKLHVALMISAHETYGETSFKHWGKLHWRTFSLVEKSQETGCDIPGKNLAFDTPSRRNQWIRFQYSISPCVLFVLPPVPQVSDSITDDFYVSTKFLDDWKFLSHS